MVDVGVAKEDSVRRYFPFSFVEASDVGDDPETDQPAFVSGRQEGLREESSPFSQAHAEIQHDLRVSVTDKDHVSTDLASSPVESDLDHERTILRLFHILLIIELQPFLRAWLSANGRSVSPEIFGQASGRRRAGLSGQSHSHPVPLLR